MEAYANVPIEGLKVLKATSIKNLLSMLTWNKDVELICTSLKIKLGNKMRFSLMIAYQYLYFIKS